MSREITHARPQLFLEHVSFAEMTDDIYINTLGCVLEHWVVRAAWKLGKILKCKEVEGNMIRIDQINRIRRN